jgi:hypothetical protein
MTYCLKNYADALLIVWRISSWMEMHWVEENKYISVYKQLLSVVLGTVFTTCCYRNRRLITINTEPQPEPLDPLIHIQATSTKRTSIFLLVPCLDHKWDLFLYGFLTKILSQPLEHAKKRSSSLHNLSISIKIISAQYRASQFVLFTKYYWCDRIKKMGTACSMYRKERNISKIWSVNLNLTL